ncbi:hypothetical protein [Acinetobacter sp.]|uniref:hypothetical protein n=1 Tax=Acinetobacter sp. TaxID=472 RepID=UPI0038901170
MADISKILDTNKVALEKKASDKFGAEVENFRRGTLQSLSPGEELVDVAVSSKAGTAREAGNFYSSTYAAALAGGTSFRPKMKFLFKVEFVFTPEAQAQFPAVFRGAAAQDFTFMVKSVDRPKIDFEYEDDINMYNFRTKVLKKIRHRELTITFIDDTGNHVLNFFRTLMMIHSPITRRQMLRELGSYEQRIGAPDANSAAMGNGMAFTDVTEPNNKDTAIRGTINSSVGNIIQTIRVKQMYVDSGAPLAQAAKEVIFDFINARLVSFDLDDLSHESSDVNNVTMQFDYDWMEIVDVGSLQAADSPHYNITVPGITNNPVDTSPAGQTSTSPGRASLFANLNTQSPNGVIPDRSVQLTAGGGQATSIPGGMVGAAARTVAVDQAGAAMNANVKNMILPPSRPPVAQMTVDDSATGGPSRIDSIVSSSQDYDDYGDYV